MKFKTLLTEEILQDTFLVKFSDCEILMEAETKEQKEKGQRIVNAKAIEPFEKLRVYLIEKYDNKKKTKEEFEKKKIEYQRYNFVLNLLKDVENGTKENKDGINYIKNITGDKPTILTVKNRDYSGIQQNYQGLPYLVIQPYSPAEYINGFKFPKEQTKEFRKIISKFIVYHEYGHLYEFLKNFVEKGESSIVDTYRSKPQEVLDSEGKANAYAIDNMYRKDRRELLKNSQEDEEDRLAKLYFDGTKKYSKEYNKFKGKNNEICKNDKK